jgi:hypothetical protein
MQFCEMLKRLMLSTPFNSFLCNFELAATFTVACSYYTEQVSDFIANFLLR